VHEKVDLSRALVRGQRMEFVVIEPRYVDVSCPQVICP
jgi:hypothetical protein